MKRSAKSSTLLPMPGLKRRKRRAPDLDLALQIVTIGVYGFKLDQFFQALQRAGVDTFCDIRWRRGVRVSSNWFRAF